MDDLTAILESLSGGNHDVKVILWARGMATSIGVQYVMRQQEEMTRWERTAPARRMVMRERRLQRQRERELALEQRKEKQKETQQEDKDEDGDDDDEEEDEEEEEPSQFVKFLILDSPFTSLKEVVLEAVASIDIGTLLALMS